MAAYIAIKISNLKIKLFLFDFLFGFVEIDYNI